MRQNPCRYCSSAVDVKGRHYPSCLSEKCFSCDYRMKHVEYLKSKRKFEDGEPITSLEELLDQEYVMWFGLTRHIEVIKHAQLSTILMWLEMGAIRKAVRKDVNIRRLNNEN